MMIPWTETRGVYDKEQMMEDLEVCVLELDDLAARLEDLYMKFDMAASRVECIREVLDRVRRGLDNSGKNGADSSQ